MSFILKDLSPYVGALMSISVLPSISSHIPARPEAGLSLQSCSESQEVSSSLNVDMKRLMAVSKGRPVLVVMNRQPFSKSAFRLSEAVRNRHHLKAFCLAVPKSPEVLAVWAPISKSHGLNLIILDAMESDNALPTFVVQKGGKISSGNTLSPNFVESYYAVAKI